MNEFTGEREWSVDLTPDTEGRAALEKLGLSDRLRDPKDGDTREGSFVSFRQREFRKDGTPNEPIRVVDADNNEWDGRLIGNGSKVDVKFVVQDYGKGKKKGMYIRAIRVLDLVPYVTQEFAPLTEDDEYFAEGGDTVEAELQRMDAERSADDLDDDIPE